MTDIHAHILPGLDDGAESLSCALEMAALAAESGVSTMIATPHSLSFPGYRLLEAPQAEAALVRFRQALADAQIPLEIYPGMEIFGTPEAPALLQEGRLLTLNHSRYPLVEFPFRDYAGDATDILEQILSLGLRPVVAHPERYQYVQYDPTLLNLWAEMGCLLQINKGSLLGRFGRQQAILALEMVARGFAHAVASDAHSNLIRTPWMGDVRALLAEEFSPAAAEFLLTDTPRRLLADEDIPWQEPDWF